MGPDSQLQRILPTCTGFGPLFHSKGCFGYAAVSKEGRPLIDLINHEEHQRILELMAANTWPDGWTSNEVPGDILISQVIADRVIQSFLPEETEPLQQEAPSTSE